MASVLIQAKFAENRGPHWGTHYQDTSPPPDALDPHFTGSAACCWVTCRFSSQAEVPENRGLIEISKREFLYDQLIAVSSGHDQLHCNWRHLKNLNRPSSP
ncbi:hypothetical protein Pan189_09120 [Stratiformator vulcanicus]|uniref:Uncharacterized protein n=1 Tax=Stratiformator vulcanicus TaxID=2527980 RepID=A0A517QY29_9PLAN|nr:hypothetical protein Pan189_09120 [Stratiformator vulcanicus]